MIFDLEKPSVLGFRPVDENAASPTHLRYGLLPIPVRRNYDHRHLRGDDGRGLVVSVLDHFKQIAALDVRHRVEQKVIIIATGEANLFPHLVFWNRLWSFVSTMDLAELNRRVTSAILRAEALTPFSWKRSARSVGDVGATPATSRVW